MTNTNTSAPLIGIHPIEEQKLHHQSSSQLHDFTSTPPTSQITTADTTFYDDFTEEDFPTSPLDDDVWTEGPILDRQLCIHKTPQANYQCSYPCLYMNLSFEMDLPYSPSPQAPVFRYDIMDLGDISSDLQDIMTTTSDEDIPDLEDISDCLDSSLPENCMKYPITIKRIIGTCLTSIFLHDTLKSPHMPVPRLAPFGYSSLATFDHVIAKPQSKSSVNHLISNRDTHLITPGNQFPCTCHVKPPSKYI